MRSLFSAELFKLFVLSGLGMLVGVQWGNIWFGLSAGLIIYIFFILRYYQRYHEWLTQGATSNKPFTNTFWSTIMDQIIRLLNDLRGRNRQLEADVDYFKESFQALESGVVVLDDRGRIDWANRAAKDLLGIELERDREEAFVNLLRAPEVLQYLDARVFDQPLDINSPRSIDIRLELQATTFLRNYTLIFVRDISELYKLESMRRDFVANVSHELRTPLTVITGYLETLGDHTENLPDVWSKAIGQMLEQSHRMDNMVEDLIWLSRLETLPGGEAFLEMVPLEGLLASVVADAKLAHPDKTIEVDVAAASFDNLQPSLDWPLQLRGDYNELRSAFSNLVQNAVKYTAVNGEIIISCYRHRDTVVVRVSDNGEGIDPVHIPRLTERFYRADSSRTSTTGGTGLGLAIVKHVLARHEGELQITSKLGRGSHFACVFPLQRLKLESNA